MSEQRVARNKVVSVSYSIRDESDNVLEQVEVPVDYLHGGDSGLFEKIEQALEGCAVGDVVEVTLSPEEGFGPRNPDLTFSDVIENVPPQYRRLGAEAEFVNEQGEQITMVVTHIDEGTVTLDGNHPMAGKTTIFRVTVVAIRDASPDEIRAGSAMPSQGLLH